MWNLIKKDKEKLLKSVKSQKDMFEKDMEYVSTQASIYQNFYDSRSNPYLSDADNRDVVFARRKFAYNIISVLVEDNLNRVARLKPKPSFIPQSHLYSLKTQIKALDSAVLTTIKKQHLYDKSLVPLKNGYIQNVGVLKSVPSEDTVKYFPVEVCDFYTSDPYNGHRDRKFAGDKTEYSLYDVYTDIYPYMDKKDKDEFIEKYDLMDIEETIESESFQNKMIDVYDFYYASNDRNGRRLVFTDECLLLDEKWEYDFIPYDFSYYIPPQKGMVGIGVSESIAPLQQRLNVLLRKVSKSMDIGFYPLVLAHRDTKIEKKITDEAGQVLSWEGGVAEPRQLVQNITSEQSFRHIDQIIHYAYRSMRSDETAIATAVPGNVNRGSGVAIKNLETAEQAKMYLPSKAYENFIISVCKKTAKYIIREGYNNIRDVIKKSDENKFFDKINTWAVSIFPSTPEGKLQRAEFFIQAGLRSPEEIADLYDFPELAGEAIYQQGAAITAIYALIEDGLKKGEVLIPDPLLGYQEQLRIAKGIYGKLLVERDKYEKEIAIIIRFIASCNAAIEMEQMKALQKQMAMQQMVAQSQQPAGGGGPPPTGAPVGSGPPLQTAAHETAPA